MTTYADIARHMGAKHHGPVDHDAIKRIVVEVDVTEAARESAASLVVPV